MSERSATAPTPVKIPTPKAKKQSVNRLTRLSSRSPAATVSDETAASAVVDDMFGFSWNQNQGGGSQDPCWTDLAGTPSTRNEFRLGQSPRPLGPYPHPHHEAPQWPDGGERRQAGAANEIGGGEVSEQRAVEAVNRADSQRDVATPHALVGSQGLKAADIAPQGSRFDRAGDDRPDVTQPKIEPLRADRREARAPRPQRGPAVRRRSSARSGARAGRTRARPRRASRREASAP